MSLIELLLLLLVAGVCGAVGQMLAGSKRGGFLTAIVLGFIGALLGAWLAREFRLPEPLVIEIGGKTFPAIWSVIGSALFVAVITFLGKKRAA